MTHGIPNISQRFINLRNRLGLSQQDFANQLGISRNYLSMIEQGREPSDKVIRSLRLLEVKASTSELPGALGSMRDARRTQGVGIKELSNLTHIPTARLYEIELGQTKATKQELSKIGEALGISGDVLISGSDVPEIRDESGVYGTYGATPNIQLGAELKNVKYIPLISFAQAGSLRSYEDIFEWEAMIAFNVDDPNAFYLRIVGDSMSPELRETDAALVYPNYAPRNGDVVIAKLRSDKGGDVMCKLFHQKQDGSVILTSYNLAYPPIEFDRAEFDFIYPVISVMKTLRKR